MKEKYFLTLQFLFLSVLLHAQMITGVWQGKVGSSIKPTRLELKLAQRGDSLFGTSYYYESANNYRRFSVKGYFNQQTNEVVWWDDELIEHTTTIGRFLSMSEIPLLMEADFNCPGDGTMKLEGKAVTKEENKNKGLVNLNKVEQPIFTDEWNWVIENYTVGANDPEIIDSIATLYQKEKPQVIAAPPIPQPQPGMVVIVPPKKDTVQQIVKTKVPVAIPKEKNPEAFTKPPAIQEKFIERKKVLTTELPLEGDTIEIHFYDNAEIDGDSISLFMNGKLVFEHVRLSDKPYVLKFAVKDLSETNELVMVAENLGSIPPNTSYMIAYVNNQRYSANLESTENSSAMIRFVRRQ